ncbi:MAG: nucleotidyl transferase AbiEii/AbiGii toxin family protein [Verrucomicrobiae bacterium]
MTTIFQTATRAAKAAGREFILIGGHAVNARGYERTTLDFDFLIPADDLPSWKQILSGLGYHPIHETKAFAQFEPVGGGGFGLDLMLVDVPTFTKLMAGSEVRSYGGCEIRVAGVPHLIALKLHATQASDRAVQGKDYYDILNLVRIHRIDTGALEFQEILNRYATPSIRDRLLNDLKRSV